MKKSLLILLGVTSMSLVGCTSPGEDYKISLNKKSLQLSVNESETLIASVEPNTITTPNFIWSTTKEAVATVHNGLVTAISAGTADINVYLDLNNNTVFDEGEPTEKSVVTVTEASGEIIPVTSLTLNPTSLTIDVNEEQDLTASFLPQNASSKDVTWFSSHPLVASVLNGRVKGEKSGNALITAYVDVNSNNELDNDEMYATAEVIVKENSGGTTIMVTSVSLNQSSLTLEEGAYQTLSATVLPTNATYKTLTWTSSNQTVATISMGRVDALKAGSTNITAYVDENKNGMLDQNELRSVAVVTVTAKESSSEPNGDLIPSTGTMLPIGNTSLSGPNNVTPIDITEWLSFDFFSTMPEYWSFIMGNNKKETSNDFYAESSGGGFKFSKDHYGLQSPLLNSWLKTEVRLKVSQVHNNSQSQKEFAGEPIFHIYSYDSTGHYLGMVTYDQRDSFAKMTEIKFYIREPEMAYFEIRLNAYPYKGSQCYNFGVSEISVKGWPNP